jgi:lysophospholipid hydrolase
MPFPRFEQPLKLNSYFSLERDLTELTVKARDFSMAMGQKWRLAMDLTYPFISYFTGHAFNHIIEKFLKDFDILVSLFD